MLALNKIPDYVFVFVDLVVIFFTLNRLMLNQQPPKYTFNLQ